MPILQHWTNENYAHKLIQINLSHDIWNCIKTFAKPTNQNFEKFRELNSGCNICITTQDITYCFLSQLCVTLCEKIIFWCESHKGIRHFFSLDVNSMQKHYRQTHTHREIERKNGTVGCTGTVVNNATKIKIVSDEWR